ncbi:MAG: hypothetical protein CSA31_03010 [Desulfobulbus propionicus]|nr:MAG: hypothetical protein CSA31_03010 [Desulfobulbus propionicus]
MIQGLRNQNQITRNLIKSDIEKKELKEKFCYFAEKIEKICFDNPGNGSGKPTQTGFAFHWS